MKVTLPNKNTATIIAIDATQIPNTGMSVPMPASEDRDSVAHKINKRFEPLNNLENQGDLEDSYSKNPILLPSAVKFRTLNWAQIERELEGMNFASATPTIRL